MGHRPSGAPALDHATIEEAAIHVLGGLFLYQLIQEFSVAPYPQTHKQREVAFRDARDTCKRTIETISAKSEEFQWRKLRVRLEEAAKLGNETAFLDALKEVNWQGRSASEYMYIINLALEAGAHLAARRLAFEALSSHRNNPEIQEYARVLAPPKVTRIEAPPDTEQGNNLTWLKDHGQEYRGRWVALRSGELLGVAGSYKELVGKIGETRGTNILLTKAF